jgi:hypothetical protein
MDSSTDLRRTESAWSGRFPLSFVYYHPIRCPACGEVIQSQVARVACGVVWCERCYRVSALPLRAIAMLAAAESQSNYWSDCHGLTAYHGYRWRPVPAHEQAQHDGLRWYEPMPHLDVLA